MATNFVYGVMKIIKKVDPLLRVPFIVVIDSVISSASAQGFNDVFYSLIWLLIAFSVAIMLLLISSKTLAFFYGYFICLDLIIVIIYFTIGLYITSLQDLIRQTDYSLVIYDGLLCFLILLGILGITGQSFPPQTPVLITITIALSIPLGSFNFGWAFGFGFYVVSKIFGIHHDLKVSVHNSVILIQHIGLGNTLIYYSKIRKISTVLRIFWLATVFVTSVFEEDADFSLHWVLVSVAAACDTKLRLLGMSLWLPELSYFILWMSRGFLNWTLHHTAEDLEPRDVSKAVVFFSIASVSSFTDIAIVQRTFYLTLLMFISCSYILQSAFKLTDNSLRTLSTSLQNSYSAHIRALCMTLFLTWVFLYTSYTFCSLFPFHVWQLVVVSSNIVTAMQAFSSLAVYALFTYDSHTSRGFTNLDDWIYYITGLSNSFEFVSAFMVLGFGLWNAVFGRWTVVGLLIIIFHTYYNLWLKATKAWKSFLSRHSAAIKLNCLTNATQEQLDKLEDVCPICFDSMTTAAKITQCGHYFHSNCLRKWLYIQSTCPLCHQDVLVDKVKAD